MRAAAPIGAALACGLAFLGGLVVAGREPRSAPLPVVVPVHVTVPPPAPTPAPEAPPPIAEAPAPRSAPRARVPHLIPECLVRIADEPLDALCAWDDGFPAISTDGKLIAIKNIPDDGGRGHLGLSIQFLDTSTGRVVRDALILSTEEFAFELAPDAATRLRGTMARRAAPVQRMLDARQFRTLLPLGQSDEAAGDHDSAARTAIHAEFIGHLMRVVDPVAGTILGMHRFTAPAPSAPLADDAMCGGANLAEITAWWDPDSRVVLGVATYHSGGCMCATWDVPGVYRMP